MEISIDRTAEQELALIKLINRPLIVKRYISLISLITASLLFMFSRSKVLGKLLPFWNFGSAFSLGILMISVFALFILLKQHLFSNPLVLEDSKIILNENLISYSKINAEIKYKWSYFKFYSLNGPLIILKKDLSKKNILIVSRNEISEQELSILNSLLVTNRIIKQ